MKVLAINGSPRKKGNTAILLNTVLDVIKEHDIDVELIHLAGKNLHGCKGCGKCAKTLDMKCNIDDDMNEIIAKVVEADGILIGSPIYFADATAEIKALIDRVGYVTRANNQALKRKLGAAVIAVRRAGAIHAFDTINHLFLINEMIIPGSSYWNIGVGLEAGDVLKDEEGISTMKTLGENFAWTLKKLH